jgi:1,4-alpha-glucan branching enzyme
MGGELAQWREWNHEESLDWHLLETPEHRGVQRWVEDLNALYRRKPALYELETEGAGFEWIDANDSAQSVLTFIRRGRSEDAVILVACNFTPIPRPNYLVGVPGGTSWREILNSDASIYGGSGWGNLGGLDSLPLSVHGRPRALNLTLPPLACVFLEPS